MLGILVTLFIVLPAVELAILLEIGSRIGGWNTLALIILTGMAGAALTRVQGFLVVARIQERLQQGEMPTEEMLDGLMVLAGGVFLLTPGVVTDLIGLFLLIPWTRGVVKAGVKAHLRGVSVRQAPDHRRQGRMTYPDAQDADFRSDRSSP